MRGDADAAAAAALLAEPARAALVLAVMDEGTLPAGVLAARAGIAPSTASEHLARLVAGGFLARNRTGRHHYHRLAGAKSDGPASFRGKARAETATADSVSS